MKKSMLLVVWLLSAVLLVAAGIGCMIYSGDIMSILAEWIGIVLVISGILQLLVNFWMRDTVFGVRSFLSRAVVTLVVGIVVLCKSFIASEVIRVLISMMVLVDGIGTVGVAIDMDRDRVPGRAWLWVIGILEAILGAAGFLKPEILNVTIGILLGISLIYEGVTLGYICHIGLKWRKLMNL